MARYDINLTVSNADRGDDHDDAVIDVTVSAPQKSDAIRILTERLADELAIQVSAAYISIKVDANLGPDVTIHKFVATCPAQD